MFNKYFLRISSYIIAVMEASYPFFCQEIGDSILIFEYDFAT